MPPRGNRKSPGYFDHRGTNVLRIHLKQTNPTADGYAFAAHIDEITESMATTGFGAGGPCVVEYETSDLLAGVIVITRAAEQFGFATVGVDDLVSASEIAERSGRTRQSVAQLIAGLRQKTREPFPSPINPGARNPLYRWADVSVWLNPQDQPGSAAEANLSAALDCAVQARSRCASLPATTKQAIAKFVAS
jgi:hypothetical protein